MKTATKITTLAATVLLAITLSACGESVQGAGGAEGQSTTQQRTADETPGATESPDPLTAEEPAEYEGDEADAKFVEIVRGELLPDTQIGNATDAQLIEAGHEACAQAEANVPWENIRVVDGEKPASSGYYMDTSAILFGAQQIYCPETIEDVG